ncbi:hypothetical protein TNCV_3439681 [Trichonephila clavipes]|nr:hypothetical protein TNCV_3439681 [Trichonephila clavipes]
MVTGLGGLEIEYYIRKSKVVDSIPTEINRFPECENRRHTCHMIRSHVKDNLSINSTLVLLVKLNHGNIYHRDGDLRSNSGRGCRVV